MHVMPRGVIRPGREYRLAVLAYVALIAYASLYPATDWRVPQGAWPTWVTWSVAGRVSRADIVSNVLAYIPLGALLVWRYAQRLPAPMALGVAAVLGGTLSLSVECVQVFLPSRVPSVIDLATNVFGTVLGAALAKVFGGAGAIPQRLALARSRWLVPEGSSMLGVIALLLWVMAQWSPFVPSIDVSTIREGLSDLRRAARDPAMFRIADALAYGLNILGLGLLAASIVKPGQRVVLAFLAAGAVVLFAKIFIVGRSLSAEALAGLLIAVVALKPLSTSPARARDWMAAACLVAGFTFAELSPGSGPRHGFSWIPFTGEIENNLNGFANLLSGTWPFVALGYVATRLVPGHLRRETQVIGAVGVAAFVFALEWMQQFIPGRYGEITGVLVGTLAWWLCWRKTHADTFLQSNKF